MIFGRGPRPVTGFSTSSSPGCAPLRRARFPALAAPALLPSARSALPPPTRAHMWIGPVAMSRSPHSAATLKAVPPAGALRLRDGGGAVRECRPSCGVRGELPSRLPSTQAEPSRRGPWRPGRSYSGALHLDAMNHARSTVCGSTADGMGAKNLGAEVVEIGARGRPVPTSIKLWHGMTSSLFETAHGVASPTPGLTPGPSTSSAPRRMGVLAGGQLLAARHAVTRS